MYLIILFFIFICFTLYYLYYKEKNKNKEIEQINRERKKQNEKINDENEKLLEKQKLINDLYKQKKNEFEEIQQNIIKAEEISKKAFENYNDILDKEYIVKEQEYQQALNTLNKSYENIQNKTIEKINQIKIELEKISTTRTAAIQAQLKEEKIKQQEQFYSLSIEDIDKREIKILQSIESELRDPRPIRMIIWQAYCSKKVNELSARVLGSKDVCGIYKITNKNNKMCYIGQAKNIRERFREHIKCGLGIDTPANNKLYQAMRKEGIENFTFELLEQCELKDLNEKEAFYIKLYDSYNFGYNSNRGIKNY